MDENIKEAVEILKKGGIVIFPTDTAFGIGCRIDNEKAVERLFNIRKRPVTQSVAVLVDSFAMAQEYLQPIPEVVKQNLIKSYWPGALTIVLSCNAEKVLSLVRGGGKTLGVRFPNHSVARELIQGVGVPILGPSANFHGQQTPYKFEDLNTELIKLVDYVLPGVCYVCRSSTVIDCTKTPWKILRQGSVKIKI